ncbi:MAG TPA: L-histidine N(alpha)-methyltransferase [Rubrivivax sp.]|nr:L-histidine N(alpha)-methyltransferase [Rubrivivax sp.]
MQMPAFFPMHRPDDAALAAEAASGLRADAAWVSPKFFYDALGSRLFDAITELDEYYPTRTEASIFAQHGDRIVDAALGMSGPRPMLVDLGAGNCAKAARLLARLEPRRYVAVDISVEFLRESLIELQRRHPQLPMAGVGLDFSRQLQLPGELSDGPALLFYPGSSIGNFGPAEALALLQRMRVLAAGGALLIGADLVKPGAVLEAAYDDAPGVTAAFNLNLLRHLNRLLGADFDLRQWQHRALFDAGRSRIEMHLESRVEQWVRWPGGERRFAAGERIHTENSYKWTPAGFVQLLRQAGYSDVTQWTDAQAWFGVFLARA